MIFNKIIPEFGVWDLQKSLSFYVNALGFKTEYQRDEAEFFFIFRWCINYDRKSK